MYVCPVCGKEYDNEEAVAKCYLKCWRENHSGHHSKSAPKSEDITTPNVKASCKHLPPIFVIISVT